MLDSDDEDYGADDIFSPGSDDELGFEEVEIGDGSCVESSDESGDESAREGEEDNDTR